MLPWNCHVHGAKTNIVGQASTKNDLSDQADPQELTAELQAEKRALMFQTLKETLEIFSRAELR